MCLQMFGQKVRYLQGVMLFCCLASNYIIRNNLSIGIVFMTDQNSTSTAKVFDWSVAEQSAAQSSFFSSYFLTNLASSVLVTKIDNKKLLLGTTSIGAVASLLTPVLVHTGGYYALICIRIILGLLQGCLLPSMISLMSRWIPAAERGRFGAIIFGGLHVGNLISFSVSAWLGDNFGWPSIFYFAGTVGAVWSTFWFFYGADSAKKCTYISEKERNYICKELASSSSASSKTARIPLKEMLTTKECWAILFPNVAHGWGYWTFVTEMPTYFHGVLHLPHTLNGIITAGPYLTMFLVSFPGSYISDFLVHRKIMSIGGTRKLFNTLGQAGPAVCLAGIAMTSNTNVVVAMYFIGVTLMSFAYIGYNINHLDILPNFAGFLMGLTNGIGNVASFAAPMFVGLVVHDMTSLEEWKIVFYVAGGILFAGNLLFVIFGSGDVLPFNAIEEEKPKDGVDIELLKPKETIDTPN